MAMSDITFSPERWSQFWASFKGEPQQLAGIEELRQHIAQSDPGLLTENASWTINLSPTCISRTWRAMAGVSASPPPPR